MAKRKLLFVINQFFKGGAETALLNLFNILPRDRYEIDLLIFDQIDFPNTISLIPRLPDWINVINIARDEGKLAYVKKAAVRLFRFGTGRQYFRRAAIEFASTHAYDVAVSYGEWFSSALVADYVRARRKYVWIHADIDKASFLHEDIIRKQGCFDGFIFASRASMESAVHRYPNLKGCSFVAHNAVDADLILRLAREDADLPAQADGRPVLLTVANVRAEKNHLRQVEVMKELRRRGVDCCWLNAGAFSDPILSGTVRKAAGAAKLDDRFLLLGPQDNPYALMRRAAAVCVLSDHESWSMVITEAKTLGVPVVATRTSGAIEQIEDGETGVLCDFSVPAIADAIQRLLSDESLSRRVRRNLAGFSNAGDTLASLEPLLTDERTRNLFVFDDINYRSGARTANLLRAERLRKEGQAVDFLSAEPCLDESLRGSGRVMDLQDNQAFRVLSVPIGEALRSAAFGKRAKLVRILFAISVRLRLSDRFYDALLDRGLTGVMERYEAVWVMSEASKLRACAARVKRPRKIQLIHTDYTAWRNLNSWTRSITSHDLQIYSRYDEIACLSERLKARFCEFYPSLRDKVTVRPNITPVDAIRRKAGEACAFSVRTDRFNLITIGRMETEKRFDRLIQAAKKLADAGLDFQWYFVGGGVLFESVRNLARESGTGDRLVLTGSLENPLPLLARCDLLVLASEYEGTPVTIEEAKALDVAVLANDVGGITDQLEGGRLGQLLPANCTAEDIARCILEMSKRNGARQVGLSDKAIRKTE